MLLDVKGLDVRYGRTHAVKNVNLSVAEGEIVTVLGANGAGKTSTLRTIAQIGDPELKSGEIWLDGEKVESSAEEVEPIYGKTYLPRKFKIALAVPRCGKGQG